MMLLAASVAVAVVIAVVVAVRPAGVGVGDAVAAMLAVTIVGEVTLITRAPLIPLLGPAVSVAFTRVCNKAGTVAVSVGANSETRGGVAVGTTLDTRVGVAGTIDGERGMWLPAAGVAAPTC